MTRDDIGTVDDGFRVLVDSHPDLIARFDRELRYIYVNPAVCRTVGKPAGWFIGRTSRELGFGDELVDLWERALRETFKTGRELTFEFTATRGGRPRTYRCRLVPEPGRDGSVKSVTAAVRDVTEFKEACERLQDSEERLRLALEAAGMGAWRYDPDTGVDIRDLGFVRIHGLRPEGSFMLVGEFLKGLHPDDRRTVLEAARRAVTERGVFDAEYRVIMPGGATRWVRSRGRVVRRPRGGGEETYIITGVAMDITEARAAAEVRRALLEEISRRRREAESQAEQVRAILENLSEGVSVVSSEGALLMRNRMARDIMDGTWPPRHPMGYVREVKLYRPDGSPMSRAEWPVTRVLPGEAFRDKEVLLERPDGTRLTLQVSGVPLRDDAGRVSLGVLTYRDVTELRRLERAKEEFIQVLAHELRNPLAAAFGLVQLATGRLDGRGRPAEPDAGAGTEADVAACLRLAEKELRRLQVLVGEILDGYRVANGRLPLDLEEVDLGEVVAEATSPYASGLFDSEVSVSGPPEGVKVRGDRRRLVEVLANLLSNAVKYSPGRARVRVGVERRPGEVLVVVEDEGIGIPPDQLEAVFQGLYRATNLEGRMPDGLGLGLYISRDIARRHGGDLWAENRPGGGTRMCLRLPLAPE